MSVVRGFRASGQYEIKPTVRKCLMIGKVIAVRRARASIADPIFRQVCLDVLGTEPMASDDPAVRSSQQRQLIEGLIEEHCPADGLPEWDVPVEAIAGDTLCSMMPAPDVATSMLAN